MASVITASNPVTAMLSCGGFRDHKGIVSALSASAGLSWQTVSGGGTILAETASVVLDGTGVTLTVAPADLTLVLLVVASESTMVTITAGAGDTISGLANIKTNRTLGLLYNHSTKVWAPYT